MKKLLLIFVSLSLLLGSLPTFAASDDIPEVDYLSRLEGLGITGVYDEHLSIDKPVRRSEFSVIITKLLGIIDIAQPSGSVYKDVSKDHVYAGEIMLVSDLGFFTGYSDGKFYPDEYVSLDEVKECLKKILGYNDLPAKEADRRMSLEIVKGITNDKYPVRGDILRILDNCLEAEVVEVQVSDESAEIYDTEKTFLSEYRDMYIARGVVTGNDVTTLTEEKSTKEGYITIDGIMFAADSIDKDYLGMYVEYYYTDIDGEYTAQFLYPIKNNILNLTDEYIVDYDKGNTALRSYMYYDYNYRLKSVSLSENLCVIINGIAEPEYSIKDTRPDLGDVRLIDNNNDDVYDVLIVFNASEEYCVAEIAYEDDGCNVLDMIDKSRICKLENKGDKEYYAIYKDGVKLTAAALKEGDSIMIGTNSKTGYKVIKASDEKVTGNLEGVSEEGIVIDGNEYKVTTQCMEFSNAGKIPQIVPGKTVTAYLNIYGKIQYIEYDAETDFKYGIYIKSFEDTDEEDRYYVKLFSTDGEIVKYIMKDKVTLGYDGYPNGRRMDVEDAVTIIDSSNSFDGGRTTESTAEPLRQLIEYRVSDKGIISAINIVASTADVEDFDGRYPLNFGGVVEMRDDYTYYPYALQSAGSMSLGGKFIATGDTYFFDIYTNEEDFICQKGTVSDDDDASLYIYDVDEKLTAGVVIRYFDTATDAHVFNGSANYPLVVTAIGKGVNEDDEVVDYIKGVENGNEVTLYYDRGDYKELITDVLDTVKPGDMLLYNLSNSGKIIGISRKLQAEKTGQYGGSSFAHSATSVHDETNERYIYGQQTQRKMYYGKVVKNINGYVIISLGDTIGNVVVNLTGFTGYVTTVEKHGNKVYCDSSKLVSDIKPGDEIVTCCRYNNKNDSVYILDYQD